ncbi:unnamed protein product [Chilo suppressalis]|uniref:Uncharacterized protein n=1 Tax=Chilo suppressalis TaxID=168631 RepID=A0ABN8B1L6_CHISP|nr:unnamed protein product [Chilo suppressalis]
MSRDQRTLKMEKLVVFTGMLALAAAAPAIILSHDAELHVPFSSKTTITKSSQHVDHGSTYVHALPVIHTAPVVHASPILHIEQPKTVITKNTAVLHSVPVIHHTYHVPQKTTVTKSNHQINHGSTHVVHASVVHTPVLIHSSPLVTLKSGDSAVSHHSSTVHETVPIVNTVPLVSYHH